MENTNRYFEGYPKLNCPNCSNCSFENCCISKNAIDLQCKLIEKHKGCIKNGY